MIYTGLDFYSFGATNKGFETIWPDGSDGNSLCFAARWRRLVMSKRDSLTVASKMSLTSCQRIVDDMNIPVVMDLFSSK